MGARMQFARCGRHGLLCNKGAMSAWASGSGDGLDIHRALPAGIRVPLSSLCVAMCLFKVHSSRADVELDRSDPRIRRMREHAHYSRIHTRIVGPHLRRRRHLMIAACVPEFLPSAFSCAPRCSASRVHTAKAPITLSNRCAESADRLRPLARFPRFALKVGRWHCISN